MVAGPSERATQRAAFSRGMHVAKPGQVGEVAALPWRVQRSWGLLLEALGEGLKPLVHVGHPPSSPPIPMPSWPPAYPLFCLPLPAHQPVCRSAQPPAFWSCWLGSLCIYVTCLPGLRPTCPPADFLLVCRPVADLLPAHLPICWLPFCLPVCLCD